MQKNAIKSRTNSESSCKRFMFNWDDGYSLPIFNESVIKASSYDKALLIFKKEHPLTKILAWHCLGRYFTTQQIIDNASSISNLEKEIYDLNESIAYDQLDDEDREQRENDVNFAYKQLEKEEEIKDQIIKQLTTTRSTQP